MLQEAIDRILEIGKPNEVDYSGRKFVDKKMTPLPKEKAATSLVTSTLSSIVDYIVNETDRSTLAEDRFIIHIANHREVQLYKELNMDKNRDNLVSAYNDGCGFNFGRFMDLEQFIINLQSCFVPDQNTAELLGFLGSVKQNSGVTQEDDGVTQKITASSGISLVKSAKAPNPVHLSPYRTFSEVCQPESSFVFRMKSDERNGITAALFEADGNAWVHDCIINIKDYFTEALADYNVIVLA